MAHDDDSHKISQEELRKKFTTEDAYFHELERQRLEAIKARAQQRRMVCRRENMPAEGCILEHVTLHGVTVDHCPTCQGVWLDAHELEEIVRNAEHEKEGQKPVGILQMLVDSLKPRG